ncbi:MAG: hypothetical protein ACKN9E_04430 [Microcystaceae cyanobacterium]
MLHGISGRKNSSCSQPFLSDSLENFWYQQYGWLKGIRQLGFAIGRVCCLYLYYWVCEGFYTLQIQWCRFEISIYRWRVLQSVNTKSKLN